MHKREQIRRQIEQIISSVNVLKSWDSGTTVDIAETDLPNCRMEVGSETNELRAVPDGFLRVLEIILSIRVRQIGNTYDALDPIIEAIEQGMTANWQLSGLAVESSLTNTAFTLDEEQPIAEANLTYSIEYFYP